MPRCIVVIPCFNEEQRLDVARFRELERGESPERIIFVNDGSSDATADILDSLSATDPVRFETLHLGQNRGKAEAVRQGMLRAFEQQPNYIGFWDADLATPLTVVPSFCSELEQYPDLQLVMGARVKLLGRHIERNAVRHYLGRVFATAVSLILRIPVYDTQCGAKMFRSGPIIQDVFRQPFHSKWIFDVEMIARMLHAPGATGPAGAEEMIHEYPLPEWRDITGSKLRLRDFARAIPELAHIYWFYLRKHANRR